MPILPSTPVNRLSQKEFRDLAFEVMQQVFAIHNEFGRFFNERVYKTEFKARMPGVDLEVAVDLAFGSFTKKLFADVLVQAGGLFEFKAAEAIHAKHRAQCIQYLLLLGLAHGKVINVRDNKVQHEFVNCGVRLEDTRNPSIITTDWNATFPGAELFRDTLVSLIRDWGCGLMLELYEEAVMHFFGGESIVNADLPVYGSKGHVANQRMRIVAPNIAFKITSLPKGHSDFIFHSQRLIRHTSLEAILWANITQSALTFTTIQ